MPALDPLLTLIGKSAVMQRVREQLARFARSPVPVLIVGETGTGKELCAAAIAQLSGRQPYVPVNCATFPDGLAESELFGHERGAFTGAVRTHTGVVALADGGVLFLDELSELPLAMQAKLLRTLESGEYRRVGSNHSLRSDFRILAATSGDLEQAIAKGRLRPDLLHRLGAVRVALPPLRQRLEDIPLLAEDFLRRYRQRCEICPLRIAPEACAALMQSEWPGNVRQLRNVIEGASAVASNEEIIRLPHVLQFVVPLASGPTGADGIPSLAQARKIAERRAILEALGQVGGNRERAAKLLRISQATLYRKLGERLQQQSA
jgi:two-component system, NtrC family, response regulator AtoC